MPGYDPNAPLTQREAPNGVGTAQGTDGDGWGRPHIELEPGIVWGQPCCHPRLPVWGPAEPYWAGESMEAVIADWPGNPANGWPALRREDVLAACWYLAERGGRTWQRRWGKWAAKNFDAMWQSKWEQVPNPPQKGA